MHVCAEDTLIKIFYYSLNPYQTTSFKFWMYKGPIVKDLLVASRSEEKYQKETLLGTRRIKQRSSVVRHNEVGHRQTEIMMRWTGWHDFEIIRTPLLKRTKTVTGNEKKQSAHKFTLLTSVHTE